MKALDTVITPIHREGRIFVIFFAAASIGLGLLWGPLGFAGLVLTAWCAYFFRDPERVVPDRTGIMVSPADGTVSAITSAAPPPELDMGTDPLVRVSVFLNVFNVHVPRAPVGGKVTGLVYVPGLFVNAADENASEVNERQLVKFTSDEGDDVALALVAGLVARRIICDLEDDQIIERGGRIGIIRFGSRADIWIPASMDVRVEVGQTMIGGETIFAERKA